MSKIIISNLLTVGISVSFAVLLGSHAFSQGGGVVRYNNQLEGRVIDEQSSPVNNAYVELYNDMRVLVSRTRTSSQGRFTFRSLRAGRYYINVKPFGTNLREEERILEAMDQSVAGQTYYEEFRLRVDRAFLPTTVTVLGTVFAQEIPDGARRYFKTGINKIDNRDAGGQADLESAIALFPTYFDALSVLGRYLVSQGKFEAGYPYLLRAIDVNKRCPECFYSLGLAFYKLDQIPAALKAGEAAVFLDPASSQTNLLHGILLRLSGDLLNAEKALLKAKTSTKAPVPEIHWQLSLLYNRMKRNQEAAKELEDYLKAKPDASTVEKEQVKSLIEQMKKQID